MMDGVNVVYEAYEARRKRVHDELKSIQMGKADRTQVISVFFILSLLILLSLLRFLFCPPPPMLISFSFWLPEAVAWIHIY